MRLIVAFWILGTIRSTALPQVSFPLHVGDVWVYEDRFSLSCEGTSIIFPIVGDTVINLQTYARFLNYSPFSGPLVRADSFRVYEYDTLAHEEYVVFDFTAKPGDTVSVRNNGAKVIIALGLMRFAAGTITYTIRDSIGVTSIYNAASLCSFALTSAWIDGIRVYLDVKSNDKQLPERAILEQNYPNPFNPGTTIRVFLPGEQSVSIGIYSPLGQQVEVLFEGRMPGGWHVITWDAQHHSSGMYLCRLKTERSTLSRCLVHLR